MSSGYARPCRVYSSERTMGPALTRGGTLIAGHHGDASTRSARMRADDARRRRCSLRAYPRPSGASTSSDMPASGMRAGKARLA